MSRKLLLGTVLLSSGILAAVFGLSAPSSVYARSLSEFVAHPVYDQLVRIQGNVVPGSLCRRENPCEYRFRLADRSSQLAVHYPRCLVPDTFRFVPGVDLNVTVEGEQCANCHHFEASAIFAKGYGKYEMKEMQRLGGSVAATPEPVAPLPVCPEP